VQVITLINLARTIRIDLFLADHLFVTTAITQAALQPMMQQPLSK
jgi:hypothetical protein